MTSTKEAEPPVAVIPPADSPAGKVEPPPKDFPAEKAEEKVVGGKAAQDVKVEKIEKDVPEKKNPMEVFDDKDRDAALERVQREKRLWFIKAWVDKEKSKLENKAQKKLSEVDAWENTKKASLEAKLKKLVESLEKKKAAYAEDMMNKVARVHKEAEEKRAMVVAKREEDVLKTEEQGAKYRATDRTPPKKSVGCIG